MKRFICSFLAAAIIMLCISACSAGGKEDKSNASNENINIKITHDSHYDTMNNSTFKAYEKAAQAIIYGDTSVSFNIQMLDDVNRLLYTSFPLIALVDSVSVNNDKTGLDIKYKNNETEHKELVAQFNNKIKSIINECSSGGVSKSVYLLNLYTYISKNVSYDNSVTTVYDTVITGKGMSASISGMFEYLLLQNGINAYHICSKDAAGNAWFWTQAQLGEKIYNFDIASENDMRGGAGLIYFALTDKQIISGGVDKGFTYTDNTKTTVCDDDTFKELRSCYEYTVKGNVINAVLYNGDTVEIQLP